MAALFAAILNETIGFLFVLDSEGSDEGGPEGTGSLRLVTGEPVKGKVLGAVVKERIAEKGEESTFVQPSAAVKDS